MTEILISQVAEGAEKSKGLFVTLCNKYFIIILLAALVVAAGCSTNTFGVRPKSTGNAVVQGLPPIFSPGKWILPYEHYPKVDGVELIISTNGNLAVTQNGYPIPFEIKQGKIVLGSPLDGCTIEEINALGASALIISGSSDDQDITTQALGQFSNAVR